MYEGYFGFIRRPFIAVPQTERYFPAGAIENARNTLARCIQRGEGAGLAVGPTGTGKTLLCLLLAEQFRRTFRVALLPGGRLGSARALYQAILYELGRPYRGMDEGELRLALVDYLTNGENPSGMVLIVDEAHTLPLRLLEEIRLLSNLARGDQPLVRPVLVGAAMLEEKFTNPRLDSFSQRLSARCYLEPFNRSETQDYIHFQIGAAGGESSRVFPEAACQSVYQATGGIPRLINQVCDHALLLVFVAGRTTVEATDVEEAWADLQQLPVPFSERRETEERPSVIEFGSLAESDEARVAQVAGAAASPDTTARFRVAAVEEEAAASHSCAAEFDEPVEQIHRIEQLLAEAEGDYQPQAGRPEVELHFPSAEELFQEHFAVEEVVVERYNSPSARWSQQPAAVPPPAPSPTLKPSPTPQPLVTPQVEAEVEESVVSSAPVKVTREQPSRDYRRLFAKLLSTNSHTPSRI